MDEKKDAKTIGDEMGKEVDKLLVISQLFLEVTGSIDELNENEVNGIYLILCEIGSKLKVLSRQVQSL